MADPDMRDPFEKRRDNIILMLHQQPPAVMKRGPSVPRIREQVDVALRNKNGGVIDKFNFRFHAVLVDQTAALGKGWVCLTSALVGQI